MTPKPRLWALVSPLATLGVIGAIAGVLYAVFVLWLAVESNAARLGIVVLAILVQLAVYPGFRRPAEGGIRRHAISLRRVVLDRQTVAAGMSGSVRLDLGGRRFHKKKTNN